VFVNRGITVFLQGKKGCTIIGYDEDAENVYKRGQYFGITAYGQPNAVGKTLSGKEVNLLKENTKCFFYKAHLKERHTFFSLQCSTYNVVPTNISWFNEYSSLSTFLPPLSCLVCKKLFANDLNSHFSFNFFIKEMRKM
jgi:hypothetical protein